jgi:hypothetical protein
VDTWSLFNTVVDFLIDIFFIIDILVNFNTAYLADGEVRHQHKDIAQHYVRTWFFADMMSSIPVDWFIPEGLPQFTNPMVNATGNGGSNQALSLSVILRLVKAVKLLRLLRVVRLLRLMEKFAEKTAYSSQGALALMKLACGITIFAHWNGCIQFLVAGFENYPEDCWVVRVGLVDEPADVKWSWAFYHAMTQMLALADGAETPSRVIELWTYLISFCSGAILYAIFLATLTSLITESNASGRAYQAKLDVVRQYMAHTKIPSALRHKVQQYFELQYPAHKAFDEGKLLSEITGPLREEVSLHNCRHR